MSRNHNIDALRIAAAIAVVVLHVTSFCMSNNVPVPDKTVTAVLTCVHLLTRWAWPVFFMITGYCLTLKRQCTYKYCLLRVLRYVSVLFTVGLYLGDLSAAPAVYKYHLQGTAAGSRIRAAAGQAAGFCPGSRSAFLPDHPAAAQAAVCEISVLRESQTPLLRCCVRCRDVFDMLRSCVASAC